MKLRDWLVVVTKHVLNVARRSKLTIKIYVSVSGCSALCILCFFLTALWITRISLQHSKHPLRKHKCKTSSLTFQATAVPYQSRAHTWPPSKPCGSQFRPGLCQFAPDSGPSPPGQRESPCGRQERAARLAKTKISQRWTIWKLMFRC
jgi:hypothetical protein